MQRGFGDARGDLNLALTLSPTQTLIVFDDVRDDPKSEEVSILLLNTKYYY